MCHGKKRKIEIKISAHFSACTEKLLREKKVKNVNLCFKVVHFFGSKKAKLQIVKCECKYLLQKDFLMQDWLFILGKK